MAKCYRHPREDALYECDMCGKPICGECMHYVDDPGGGDPQVVCPMCDMGSAAAVSAIVQDKRETKITEETAEDNPLTTKQRLNVRLNSMMVLAIFVLAGIYTYLDQQVSLSQEPISYSSDFIIERGNPSAQFTMLLVELMRYREDHGEYPDKLDDLVGRYIDGPPTVGESNQKFQYVKDVTNGFVLSLPDPERYEFLKLYVTANGDLSLE
ncbi:MAG: hypothetical protein H6684_05990 [Deltaproteobacteria bacterium]|nr:hypothetical protein [Deltaproteobacteria bacterium]MCB9478747.1 hypothetical protein [Deltaproteobacteria bacterium]MCB9488263.1 hypothetical protein [Deltaproteobacteria bacterium]